MMKLEFEKKYLCEFYIEGKVKNKKYTFPKAVIEKFKDKIDILKVVNRVEDLFLINSLNYEKLKGKKKALNL